MAQVNYTATIIPNGMNKRVKLRATGVDAATAKAAMQKKIALIPCAVVEVIESNPGNLADYPAHSAGTYNDLTLTLSKPGVRDRNVTIRNVANVYAVTGDVKGRADIANADLLAFATAFYDGNGETGYALIGGQFHSN